MAKTKKYRAIVEYEVSATADYRPTLQEERNLVNANTLADEGAFEGANVLITKVHVEVDRS